MMDSLGSWTQSVRFMVCRRHGSIFLSSWTLRGIPIKYRSGLLSANFSAHAIDLLSKTIDLIALLSLDKLS